MSAPASKLGRQLWAVAVAALLLSCAGCWKKSGPAEVTAKDYVPARVANERPNESPTASLKSGVATSAEQTPSEPTEVSDEVQYVEDESEDLIGPPLDSRATDRELWIVGVRLIESRRRIDVRVDQPQFEKLHLGDRVHLRYREGKYTGTVWASEID